TKLSFSVINTLEKYAPDIAKPDMTQRLEEDMERVALGDVQPEDVLDESRTLLKNALSKLEKSKESISEDLKNGIREDAVVGTCRLCGSPLIIRRSRKGGRFIGCSGYPDCTFTLPLPRNGNIRVMDKVCEKHGIHHLQIYTKGKRPWNIGCPECNYEEWKQSQLKTKTKD
ncbi:MAG: topoisomerase DNA-binding C4 zinc finger domain-containing protein, partial [Methermicoccaceae archaeon]